MSGFTTMARLVSHLGDQLISNSTVAILELIKNAYDATTAAGKEKGFIKIHIDQANRTMTIEDNGHGMTREDIENKYLVIGTTDRLETKENIINTNESLDINVRTPQGEKGLGRFATMKLGHRMVLLTKSNKSYKGCLLGINWNDFSYSSKKRLDEVSIHQFSIDENSLKMGGYKDSFTKIKIYELKDFCDSEEWSIKNFESFYKQNFAKFLNPFKPNTGFQIKLEVTTAKGDFHRFYPEILDRKLLEQAPYRITGLIDNLDVKFEYYIRGEDLKEHRGIHNGKISGITLEDFEEDGNLGSFEFELYFYNRNSMRLKEIKGYESLADLRKSLNQYCGGIMIYRDGFRVLPYAEPGNDWLELNSKSYGSSGIRFNTIQTVGAIYINIFNNPNLRDQTNREGIVENKAYNNLKQSLWSTLTSFINIISGYYPPERKKKGPITTNEMHNAIKPIQNKLTIVSDELVVVTKSCKAFMDDNLNVQIKSLENHYNDLKSEYEKVIVTLNELDIKIKQVDEQQRMIIDLAGIGMTAETVAHEIWSCLGRITSFLAMLKKEIPGQNQTINTLLYNTKALETVISRLDVQTITRRRTKSKINISDIVKGLCKSKSDIWNHENKEKIEFIFGDVESCIVKANQGMLVQVFDNIINNSHYWLLKHKQNFPNSIMEININITKEGYIEIFDTGFGIDPIDSNVIFDPFFTRKKSGDGRGLGLYIVQELLNFHEADIILSDELNEYGRLYKFVLDFSKCLVV